MRRGCNVGIHRQNENAQDFIRQSVMARSRTVADLTSHPHVARRSSFPKVGERPMPFSQALDLVSIVGIERVMGY